MTPRQALDKLKEEATTEIGRARYEGALVVYECYLDKQRKYYDTHREHHNEYQREYQRKKKWGAEYV